MNFLFLLVVAGFGFFSFPATVLGEEDFTCKASFIPTNHELPIGFLAQINKHLSIMTAKENLNDFCYWNRVSRSTFKLPGDAGKKAKDGIRDAGEHRDKEAAFQIQRNNFFDRSPWQSSMTGDPRIKDWAKEFTALSIEKDGKLKRPKFETDIQEIFSTPFSSKTPYPAMDVKLQKKLEIPMTMKVGGCSHIDLTATLSCVSALAEVENIMSIHANVKSGPESIAPAEPFKRLVSDTNLTEGLRLTVLKMMDRWNKKDISGNANIYEDILSSFKQSGLGEQEALDATWDLIATLANSGPNMGLRVKGFTTLSHNAENPNALAMTVIAELLPFMDTVTITSDSKRLYSLPANAYFPCDVGKSYHFWMAAYLTRELIKKGVSPKGARSAAFVSNIGYQLKRTMGSGATAINDAELLNPKRFGETENGIRFDLALAAAGAKFGEDVAAKKDSSTEKLDIAQALFNGFDAAGTDPEGFAPDPIVKGDPTPVYRQWVKNMNPKAFYNSFK